MSHTLIKILTIKLDKTITLTFLPEIQICLNFIRISPKKSLFIHSFNLIFTFRLKIAWDIPTFHCFLC